jgi:ABC-type phosphate/phosphonate transport system permease subunit
VLAWGQVTLTSVVSLATVLVSDCISARFRHAII